MARTLMVRIVGDSSSAEAAFQRTADSATAMNAQMRETDKLFRVRAGRGATLGLLRIAGVGVAAGVGIAAATKAVSALSGQLRVSGNEAATFSGKLRNVGASLLSGDVVGAISALDAQTRNYAEANVLLLATMPKTIEQIKKLGGAADVAAAGLQAMQQATVTPPLLQLRQARAALTPGRGDDLRVLNQQIAQTEQAERDIKKLRAATGNENAAALALAQVLQDRKKLEDQRTALLKKSKQRDPFGAVTKGLGLKAEKAQLTKTLTDDIAASDDLIAAIQREIAKEGKTFDLIDQLTKARLARQGLIQEQTAQAQAAAAAEKARRQAAAERAKAAAERAKELAQRRLEQRRGRQFEALGLTATGEDRAQSEAVLRRRRARLEDRIKGTALDTETTRRRLEGARRVLRDAYGKAGRDVRLAIQRMFDDIDQALKDRKDKGTGPLTRTSAISSRQIMAGLGLSPEQERRLRARLSNFNTAGRGFATSTTTSGRFAGAEKPVVVESHTTVNLDGHTVANVVTRHQQRGNRRNPPQKRGPNRRGA